MPAARPCWRAAMRCARSAIGSPELYQLTPGELRVLFGIVEIGGVPEVANALGISQTTAKTHLQHVFEKTGTNRQADLVKLVAGDIRPPGLGNGGGVP